MSNFNYLVNDDFNKAYFEATIGKIIDGFQGKNSALLPLNEILRYIKIKNESYKGMQFVKINDIIGSEGRYNDFNKEFLPRKRILKTRWEKIDEAHYKDIILPPVQLYKIGKVYFVRDGNHRVSVARRQGKEFIDAEVTEIKTDIEITPSMTISGLIEIIMMREKKNFLEMTGLDKYRDVSMLNFTSTGRFDEILTHINGHQYFMGIEKNAAVTFHAAMISWYDNLFIQIVKEIEEESILKKFPGRTSADLYVWIIKHWHFLKNEHGQQIKISDAVKSYKENFGEKEKGLFEKVRDKIFGRRK
jgi:hypothetical protein